MAAISTPYGGPEFSMWWLWNYPSCITSPFVKFTLRLWIILSDLPKRQTYREKNQTELFPM